MNREGATLQMRVQVHQNKFRILHYISSITTPHKRRTRKEKEPQQQTNIVTAPSGERIKTFPRKSFRFRKVFTFKQKSECFPPKTRHKGIKGAPLGDNAFTKGSDAPIGGAEILFVLCYRNDLRVFK